MTAREKAKARAQFLRKKSCLNGDDCRTWFTCGRKHSFPSVDHGNDDCPLDYLDCIAEHYRHECAHDFLSGPFVEGERFTTSSCACGVTSMAHDMAHSP